MELTRSRDYDSNKVLNDDKKINNILDVTYNRSKITKFLLSGNTVQLQEYVYKTNFVQTFVNLYQNLNCYLNHLFDYRKNDPWFQHHLQEN